jgi:hypothetical protein
MFLAISEWLCQLLEGKLPPSGYISSALSHRALLLRAFVLFALERGRCEESPSHIFCCAHLAAGAAGSAHGTAAEHWGSQKGEKEKRKEPNEAQDNMPACGSLSELDLFLGHTLCITPARVEASGMQLTSAYTCQLSLGSG